MHPRSISDDFSGQFEQVKKDQQARIAKMRRIEDVFGRKKGAAPKVYSDIVGMVPAEAWNRSREAHLSKLRKYREQKDYQIFIEEDEDDIEGEKIYSSIKNLHAEKFYHHYFYADPDRDTATRAGLEQMEGLKEMDDTLRGGTAKASMNDTFGATPSKVK